MLQVGECGAGYSVRRRQRVSAGCLANAKAKKKPATIRRGP